MQNHSEETPFVPVEIETPQNTLRWINLNVSTKSKRSSIIQRIKEEKVKTKRILKDICGEAKSGALTAMMGSSGSGKTTLINMLAGVKTKNLVYSGTILFNNQRTKLKSLVAYVEQTDSFIPEITVQEQLNFCCHLVLHDQDESTIVARVSQLLSEFGLEKCRNTYIGDAIIKGISGGEKRRLSIAVKVIRNKKVILLDEPTSGLDSYIAETIVRLLKKLSETSIVLCTIHQPSSQIFNTFDNLVLMSEGSVVYSGSRHNALGHFSQIGLECPMNYNPADFYIDKIAIKAGEETESREIVEKLTKMVPKEKEEINYKNYKKISFGDDSRMAGFFTQFKHLLKRAWLTNARNPILVKARFIQAITIILIYGLLYLQIDNTFDTIQTVAGSLNNFLTEITFSTAISVLMVFGLEKTVFLSEHRSNLYGTPAYYLSKTLVDMPVFLITPVVFSVIGYFMIGYVLNPAQFFIFLATLILVSFAASSFGYMIAAISPHFIIANQIAIPIIVPLMIFGGFLMRQADVPKYLSWLTYVSWFRYAFEILVTNQFTNIFLDCRDTIRSCPNNSTEINGEIALDILGLVRYGYGVCFAALIILTIGFRTLGMLFLMLQVRLSEK